jgi:nicotinamidase-related amidase
MGERSNQQKTQPEDRPSIHEDIKSWSPDTWQKYSQSGLGAKVGFGKKPAILVIDMSKAFNDPAYGVGGDQTEAVNAIAGLLPVARRLGVPVVFTTMAYLPDGSDLGIFGKKIPALAELRLDDPAAVSIDDRITPVSGEFVINKKCASAFFGTNLLPLLVKNRIDTLIVTGCSTSGCIRATVIDGASNGFRVIVPQDCVSDRAEAPHLANLFDIKAKYGDVVPSSEVIAYLEKLIAKNNQT